jgi:hypothetical protein
MDLPLLTVIALVLLILCIFSYKDIPKTIDDMDSSEIVADFEANLQNNKKKGIKEDFTSTITNTDFMDFSKGWDLYTQTPLLNWKSTPKKAVFYEKTLYRKPYRYPFQYLSSYPVSHWSFFQN